MITAKILGGTPSGQVCAPPSKSYAHRAVLAAALAGEISQIKNVGANRDILATLDAVSKMGAGVKFSGGVGYISGPLCTSTAIDCGESGSTLRFLAPIMAMLGGGVLTGRDSLLTRPMQVYEQLFPKMGSLFELTKQGFVVGGPLQGGDYTLVGNISSQFITGLLYALPLAKTDSTLHIVPPFESASYVDMSIYILNLFGIQIQKTDPHTFFIKGNQKYTPCNYTVEGDWSSAAFFAVLGALKGSVTCTGLNTNSLQADSKILSIVKQFGADVTLLSDGFTVNAAPLMGRRIDISDCPDLGPVLMALGVLSRGFTVISGAKRLAYKESNRIQAMCAELEKIGGSLTYQDEIIEISGGYGEQIKMICAHNDHRVAMSMAVVGAVLPCGIVIADPQVTDKSYPEFFEDLKALNIKVRMRSQND